jgi:transcription elongation factor S-II
MPPSLKEYEEKAIKEQLHFAVTTSSSGTRTNTFQCGKCRGKDTMYTQAQTRRFERKNPFYLLLIFVVGATQSSDEPMTTFVVCNLCGNRWSFS